MPPRGCRLRGRDRAPRANPKASDRASDVGGRGKGTGSRGEHRQSRLPQTSRPRQMVRPPGAAPGGGEKIPGRRPSPGALPAPATLTGSIINTEPSKHLTQEPQVTTRQRAGKVTPAEPMVPPSSHLGLAGAWEAPHVTSASALWPMGAFVSAATFHFAGRWGGAAAGGKGRRRRCLGG